MKKLLAILLSGLMLMSVMSVSAFGLDLPDISEIAPEEGVTFYALVIDASVGSKGYGSLQLCALNINDINHRGLYTASLGESTELLNADGEITIDDISMGDIIALTYTGDVLESYPSQILETTRVYVVDHVGTLAEIEAYIPEWCDDNGDYFPAWNVFASIAETLDCTVSDGKVALSWRNTSDETYTVYWKRSSSDEWKVAGTTSKHKVNITGLKNGVSYDFKVEISGQDSEVVTATPVEATYLYAISTVSARSEPSYASDRWGTYSCGDKVEILSEVDGWYEVNYPYSETSKYVNAAYLSEEVPDGTAEDEPVVDLIDRDGVFIVRSDTEVLSDMVNGEVLGTLEKGETVEVTGIVVSNWLTLTYYQISYDDGIAYVSKKSITDPDFKVEALEIDVEDLADREGVPLDNRGYVEICVAESSITSTGATFKIRNLSEYMVDYGEDYSLQVYENGKWSDVELIVDSYDVTAIAYMVWAGGDVSAFDVNWSYFYGELPAGHYRLVKGYFYETDSGNVFVYGVCGFDIE